VVSGGEPTIHDGLPGLVGRLRALGYVVKLDTNGSRPGMLLRLLKAGLVDYVAMDVKAPLRADAYRRLAGVEVSVAAIDESIRLIADSGAPHEFRTTYVPALHDVDDIGRIRESLPPGSLHRVQRFRPKHALDPRLRVPCPAGSDMPSDPDPRDSRSWTGAAGPRSRGAAGGARRVAGSAQESVAT
jgi:pyruvate formate lyase activating enzyme